MVKVTRDAQLDLDEDVSKSYIDKITESVKERLVSDPVRLVYDKKISKSILELIILCYLDLDSQLILCINSQLEHIQLQSL